MSHLLSAPLRAQSIGHMVHWRVRTEAQQSRRSGARRAVLTRLWKPCGTLQKREEEQRCVIPRNRTTRPARLTYQSEMAWEPSPASLWRSHPFVGSGTDPVLPRSGLLRHGGRKVWKECRRAATSAPFGGGLGAGTPRRATGNLCVQAERTGGVSRATDRTGARL
jgi:hypothetical protein